MTTLLLGRYRWLVCALLFLATTINYVDRQILSLLKSTLDAELHWTNADFGDVNAAFSLAYAFGLLLFGKFIDRFGVKIGYAASIVAWSLAAAGHALVGSVNGFIGVPPRRKTFLQPRSGVKTSRVRRQTLRSQP